jgi:hypothetical protein
VTSLRQLDANRRNALKSTGPKSELGKQHSRCNAMRHGLTAETVSQRSRSSIPNFQLGDSGAFSRS